MKNISKKLKLYKAGYLAYFISGPLPLFHTIWNLVYILFMVKIVLYFRCYRSDPDPLKKIPYPAGQKSPEPDPHPNFVGAQIRSELYRPLWVRLSSYTILIYLNLKLAYSEFYVCMHIHISARFAMCRFV